MDVRAAQLVWAPARFSFRRPIYSPLQHYGWHTLRPKIRWHTTRPTTAYVSYFVPFLFYSKVHKLTLDSLHQGEAELQAGAHGV
jgi:hypothetical protein